MDALMAALVVGALASVGDKPAWLAAILADRTRAVGLVIVAAALALAGASAIAAVAGSLIAPRMTPEASELLLALSLALQGGGALGRVRSPERLERWRIGSFATALAGLFILAFGDGLQFVVLGPGVAPPLPWLAAAGGTVGALAVVSSAAVLGERGWLALPQRPARLIIAILFLIAAVVLALDALCLT